MIQNIILWVLFLNTLFRVYNFIQKSIARSLIIFKKPRKMTSDFFSNYIFVQGTSSEFIFDFRFSSRKSISQQKLAKNITHFAIQFRPKNLTHFTNLNSLDIEKSMLSQHSQSLSHFINFRANIWLVSEKAFALHHF